MTKVTAEKMTKASRNAKHVSIKAKDLRGLVFVARSQSNPNESYEVRLALVNGQRMWECACRGYERFQYCKHTFAAVVLVLGIKESRRIAAERAEKLAATDGAEAASDAGTDHHHPSVPVEISNTTETEPTNAIDAPGLPADADITGPAPNVETFCADCGRETGGGRCDVDTNAAILTRREMDERDRENSVLIRPEPRGHKIGGMSI